MCTYYCCVYMCFIKLFVLLAGGDLGWLIPCLEFTLAGAQAIKVSYEMCVHGKGQ